MLKGSQLGAHVAPHESRVGTAMRRPPTAPLPVALETNRVTGVEQGALLRASTPSEKLAGVVAPPVAAWLL